MPSATRLTWQGDLRFTGVNQNGVETVIDGDGRSGVSPVEMVLEALGTCPAVDVVTILAKMRESLKRLEITVDAERNNEPPRYIKSARVYFDLWGEDLNPEKVVRAIDLAFTKYCSVFHSLRDDLILLTAFRLHPVGAEAAGEYTPVELTPEVVG